MTSFTSESFANFQFHFLLLNCNAAPSGPPLDVNVTAVNSSSLFVSWKEPVAEKQNGVIVSYTVCISLVPSNTCLSTHMTTKKTFLIKELIAYTNYYVKVRARTKMGIGPYSLHQEKTTKPSKCWPQRIHTFISVEV